MIKNGYLFKRGDYKGISILIKKLSSDRKLINRVCEESIKDAIKDLIFQLQQNHITKTWFLY